MEAEPSTTSAPPPHVVSSSSSSAPAPAPEVIARRTSSTWTVRENLTRLAWMFVQATLFRFSFHSAYRWRRFLLRAFGATVGRRVLVRPTARVEIPWHLEIGDDSAIGDF